MDNNALFLEAVINSSHTVYGHKLRPLTLFHLSLLEQIKSPLLVGGPLQPSDIATAAIICSSRDSQEYNKNFRKLLNPVTFLFYKPEKELNRWNEYWNDYFSVPETLQNDNSKEYPLPYTVSCAAGIIKQTGWSFDYVFHELPIGLLIWLNTGFNYIESGETSVISDKEREIMAQVKALTVK